MNIVDSSGWLEYFSDGPNAKHYLPPLHDSSALIVPVITIPEVFKVVLRESSENDALQAVAAMQKGKIIDLTANMAMNASKLSLQHNLTMADSIILAIAQAYQCVIWTQDSDFREIEGVNYFPKQSIRPTLP
ncbi:MAG: type II toxin-antitoxin system VapC family toxin [Thermodesulfobacteriota bacterium]|nr:type II toxin-antitoxin system VapC family toxin [Thermodesulfobacteriota bacterium]